MIKTVPLLKNLCHNRKTGHLFIIFAIVGIVASLFFTSGSIQAATSTVVRGVSGDMWADIVIGQRDFTEINPNEIVGDKVFNAGGVIVDNTSANQARAYVWDSNNNRILGIDLNNCYAKTPGTRCVGQIVLGQPSLNDYGACNRDSSSQSPTRISATSSSLCGIADTAITLEEQRSKSNMVVDPAGNLYVPDLENNRVLKYISPFATDTIADGVWGQSDFAGNLANKGGGITASSLSFDFGFWGSGGIEKHGGVAIDQQGNLWVADTANSRVLRFPVQAGIIAKTADIVIGQATFTTGVQGTQLNQLRYPTAVTFDGSGKLYVADSGNTRILAFTPAFVTGMSGTIFGNSFAHNQPYSSDCNTVQGGYTGAYTGCDGNPWDVQVDPLGQGIWTYETMGWDSRARLWSFTNTLLKSIDNTGLRGGGSLGLDKLGNVLVSQGFNSDISRFQPQVNGSFSQVQSFFSPPAGHNLVTNRRLNLNSGSGLAVVGDQLVVADGRLLFWNGLSSLTNGKAANGYLRTSSTDSINSFTSFIPNGTSYIQSSNNKLWVSARDKILIYQSPLVSAAVPVKTITSVSVLGGGVVDFSLGNVTGIAVDPADTFLWVTQSSLHRVLRIRDPLSTSPVVDVILGQLNLSSVSCNQNPAEPANTDSYAEPNPASVTLKTLCYPGALAIDKKGNLYVSDHWHELAGNKRLLMYSAATFPAAPTSLLTASSATKEFPKSQQFATWEPAFDSANHMVVGYNTYVRQTNRLDFFNDPTAVSTTPSGQLNDFDAWPIAATFDSQDNLYVYEANRGQVRVYTKPFVIPTASPSPSPTPTKTPTPSATPRAFIPTSDTYIASDAPTSTFGGTAAFLYTNGKPTVTRQAFIRFDLTTMLGRTISKAVLKVHTTSASNASSLYSQDVRFVNNNLWTEQSMSWNNTVSPSDILTTPIGTLPNANLRNTSYDIPLTTTNVQSHLGSLYSLQLSSPKNDDLVIGSRESTMSAQLILSF